MVAFSGRVEARFTVPTGGASVSVTNANGGSAATVTVPAASYYLTAAGGVSSLLDTLETQLNENVQGYPQTAAAMAAAVGYGTWSAGWLFNIASGNDSGAFGGVTMTAVSSPTYSHTGPAGGIDKAVGFDSSADAFNGGDVFDVTNTDDIALAWIGYIPADPGATRSWVTKLTTAAGWHVFVSGGVFNFRGYDAGASLLFNATGASIHANEWHVGIATIDRATGKARIATRGLHSGTNSISSEVNAPATTMANAINFLVGDDAFGSALTGSLMAGLYIGTGSGAAIGLSANIATALANLANAVTATWNVSMSTTTGRIAISNSFWNYSIDWTSTALRDLLGFTGSLSGATTQTGTQQAKGLWLPDCPLNLDGDPDQVPRVSDLRTTRGPTGNVLGLSGNSYYRHRNIVWSHVPRSQVWESAATYDNGSWESFFETTQMGFGHSWFTPASKIQIWFDDAGSDALVGGDFNDGAGVSGWSIIGLDSIEPKKSSGDWTGLWRIEIPELISNG